MPYQIDRYNGTPLVTVDDGTVSNEKTTLKLVGKNYAGYGEIQNENFVFLMENFANAAPPANHLSGQIWFDNFNRKLKFNDGNQWRTTGGAEIGPTPPTGLTTGDFWWNTTTKQLFSYDGISEYVLVGPQAVAGAGDTLWESVSLVDTDGNSHPVMKALIDGDCLYIVSTDSFTIDSNINPVTGFSFIKQGITQVDTTTLGVTTSAYRMWGTASDSDRLGTRLAAAYVTRSGAVFDDVASFSDDGLTVGVIGNLKIYAQGGETPTIENLQSNVIHFKVKTGVPEQSRLIMQVLGGAVDPGLNRTYDLGEDQLRWRNIYAQDIYADGFHGGTFTGSFNGISTKADTLYYARASTTDKYRSATDENTANSIMARNSAGDFTANIMTGTATRARYADLAERYEADFDYEPGTVVIFGGVKEITVTTDVGDTRVAGVISTDPAYLMNVSPETESFLPVALRGKVPVKVIGKVKKGDVLVTSNIEGHAVSVEHAHQVSAAAIVAKAIEEKNTDESGVVMAVIV